MSTVAKVFQVLEAVVAYQERGLAYSEVVAEDAVTQGHRPSRPQVPRRRWVISASTRRSDGISAI